MESEYGKKNSVRADNQLDSNRYVSIINNLAKRKVLFVGNSITKHGPAPNIGWFGDWGMAATQKENDYVHLIMKKLEESEPCDFCIAQCSRWESSLIDGKAILDQYYKTAREFNADIIIVRIGENIKADCSITECKKCFFEMIDYFNPSQKSKVILTNLFWKNESLNNMIKEIADENGFVLCDISDLEQDEKTMALNEFEHEGVAVHPSDFGMKCIADKILKCIYKLEDLDKMEIRNASNPKDVKHYDTDRLREEFHISKLFTNDNIRMVYSHIDRIITAGLMPVYQELRLEGGKELASDYFLERREMGCINVGGKGIITVDGTEYEMNPRDGIYIGMGNKEITFKSVDTEDPAKFYVSSCPAHATYPIVKIDITKAKKVPCGSVEDCNKRVINQYIHPEVIKSCQLAMGLTQLEPGSNWNTMPSHTHDRRMEVYMYLDMGENDAVFHMMGEPNETRHIVMHNEEAVISPSWSIHSGVGTKNYSFIWAMCGENQEFTDMDHIDTRDLR